MYRYLAVAALLAASFVVSAVQSQDAQPGAPAQDSPPRLRITSKDNVVELEELINVYAGVSGKTFVYDKHAATGSVSVATGQSELYVTADELPVLIADALFQQRKALVSLGGDRMTIASAADSATFARPVTLDELGTAPEWEWVSLTYVCKSADPNSLRGALQNHTTRQGGQINPLPPRGLTITDRISRIRDMVKMIEVFDPDPDVGMETRVYETPEGVKAEEVSRAISTTILTPSYGGMRPGQFDKGTVSALPSSAQLVVRAKSKYHEEVAKLLADLAKSAKDE